MILDPQYLFLMLHSIIGGTPVCYQLSIEENLDIEKFENSLNAVIQAQPALHQIFSFSSNSTKFSDWYSSFPPPKKILIQYKDLRSILSPNEEIEKKYKELLNRRNPLNKWPLYEFILYQTDAKKYILLAEIDHVISDGLGNVKLFHEWLSHYAGLSSPIQYTVDQYVDVVSKINNYEPSKIENSSFQQLIQSIKKQSYKWNPHNKRIQNLNPTYETISKKISKNTLQKWITISEKLRVTLYSTIVCSYVDLFFKKYAPDAERLVLTLPTSGKIYPEIDASNFIGCFAQALTLVFERSLVQLPLDKKLKKIHQQIYHSIQTGFDRIQTKKLADSIRNDFNLTNGKLSEFSKMLFFSSMKSNIYISYTGHSPIQKNYKSLQITGYKEGTFNNAGVCDFMHSIIEGELYLFGNYDTNFFEYSLIDELMNSVVDWYSSIDHSQVIDHDNTTHQKVSSEIFEYLSSVFESTHKKTLQLYQMKYDLESKLGLDSLGRIRLIARISKDYQHQLNQNDLMNCRTLLELAEILHQHQNK